MPLEGKTRGSPKALKFILQIHSKYCLPNSFFVTDLIVGQVKILTWPALNDMLVVSIEISPLGIQKQSFTAVWPVVIELFCFGPKCWAALSTITSWAEKKKLLKCSCSSVRVMIHFTSAAELLWPLWICWLFLIHSVQLHLHLYHPHALYSSDSCTRQSSS